jgi:hypothetical protein
MNRLHCWAWQRGLAAAVLLGVLVAGCQEKASAPPPDRKAQERELEKLRKEHEREMKNK